MDDRFFDFNVLSGRLLALKSKMNIRQQRLQRNHTSIPYALILL